MAFSDLVKSKNPSTSGESPPHGDETPVSEEPDALPADPPAAHRAAGRPRKSRPKGPIPTTVAGKKKLQQEVHDNLTMFLGLGCAVGLKADPTCFGSLAQQSAAIVDALVPIIMRNTALLRWFAGADAKYLEYLGLAKAFGPVVATVFQHHVAKGHQEGSTHGPLHDLNTFQAPAFV